MQKNPITIIKKYHVVKVKNKLTKLSKITDMRLIHLQQKLLLKTHAPAFPEN